MSESMSVWSLLLGASWVVQFIMLLLLVFSIISWMLIFKKNLQLENRRRAINEFEEKFWSGAELATLYQHLNEEAEVCGLDRIFMAGFREYNRLAQP